MKTNLRRLSLCAIAALAVTSCVHPLEDRIASNPQIYQSLSTSDQLLVRQGRIREGMTKEGVFLAMGRADHVAVGRQKGVSIEKWSYMGSQPIYGESFGLGYGGLGGRGYGYGYSPFGYSYSPSIMYVPYQAATVTFRGNRVSEYLQGRQ